MGWSAPHSLSSFVFLFLISGLSAVLVFQVLPPRQSNAASRLEFFPHELGSFNYGQLALISFLSLYLEMLMIRWVSSEVWIFAYFKNFVLVACFLGFGLGCYLCRGRIRVVAMIAPILLLTIILKTPISPLRRTITALPQLLGAGVEVHVWGVPAVPASWTGMLLALVVVVPLFMVVAIVFIPCGQLVGWYLENAPDGVKAYSVNVLASLGGIALFTVLCFADQPPWVWFAGGGIFTVLVFRKHTRGRTAFGITFLLCIGLLAIPDYRHASTFWSPYQKLTLQPIIKNGELDAYYLMTNDNWYQKIVDLSPPFVHSHPDVFSQNPVERNSYNMPYHFYPSPPSVLVLGSGMGNDVAAAEAVEIDPLIVQLGRELHPEHPYQSPRVHVTVNEHEMKIDTAALPCHVAEEAPEEQQDRE